MRYSKRFTDIKLNLFKGLDIIPKEYRCFFLPGGYRVATDLVYWEIDKHAAFGTMEYIMNSYNDDIVPKLPGIKTGYLSEGYGRQIWKSF